MKKLQAFVSIIFLFFGYSLLEIHSAPLKNLTAFLFFLIGILMMLEIINKAEKFDSIVEKINKNKQDFLD